MKRPTDFLHVLAGADDDYDPLLEAMRDARFVLLGEASHGTDDFYRARAAITRRLLDEHGFGAVAVEGDWPDAYRVNRYVRGESGDADADEALSGFKRFPTWMWRNSVVVEFVEWLRRRNAMAGKRAAGFYGLDLYSLFASMEAVLQYLDRVDPEAARRARYRYRCFEHFGEDTQAYGYAASFGMRADCEDEVVRQLEDLLRRAAEYTAQDGRAAADEYFFAAQNARLVRNAEEYYRTMFRGRVSSWNLRDRHMMETLEALARHLSADGAPAKIVVWAHNSHLGDARATEMGRRGEWNLGQLCRERFGSRTYSVGFTTYAGTVMAASDWDGPAEVKRVRPGLRDSYEALLHSWGVPRFLALLQQANALTDALREPRLERAIGVIYLPETERLSHYFTASIVEQFDALIHFDETRALRALERVAEVPSREAPETFPTGR
jgi:erythromycin esterase-like protein